MRLSSSRSTAILHRPQQDFLLWDKAGTRPSLDQQFADRKDLIDAISGQQLITHTRASSGTYVGSDGLIKTATTNEARFDHDPVTGESLGLLVEESRTNLLQRSEEFDTTWASVNCSLTAASGTAPDGSNTAWEVKDTVDGSAQIHNLRQNALVAAGTAYTFSCFFKAGTLGFATLTFTSSGFSSFLNATVNLSDLTVNASTGMSTVVSAYPNGWVRLAATATATVTSNTALYLRMANPAITYQGDGTGTILLWGAQLEEGSFLTSYIPTTSSTVTRSADVATDTSTGANIRTLYAEFRSPGLGTQPIGSLDDDTANERIELLTSGTDPKLLVTDGGSAVADIDAGTVTANTLAKLAARFATDDYAAAVDGGTLQTDTSGTLPTVDRVRIGSNQAGDYFTGTIARITGWDEGLPDTAVEGITQ